MTEPENSAVDQESVTETPEDTLLVPPGQRGGLRTAFNMPARQSYVADLVGTENLMNAIALNSGIMTMTRIVGPALAGVLIGLFGVGPVYYTKAGAYVIFVIVLFLISITGEASSPLWSFYSPASGICRVDSQRAAV